MMRKRLLLDVLGPQSWVNAMRYLSQNCVPSLFRALHSDADFVASICASDYGYAFLMEYLAMVPAGCVSMRAIFCVVSKFDVLLFFSSLTHICRLEDVCKLIDHAKPKKLLVRAELDVLRLLVEELLFRLGMYSSALPMYEDDARCFVATAERIFMAIPCDVVLGRHLQIAANTYTPGLDDEWCCIMRKVASILCQTPNYCETCLYQAWSEQWDRYAARNHF